jgi:hypothetical protein
MRAKEDPEWERKVGEWIEDVLGRKIENTSDLFLSLKSGVVLCECESYSSLPLLVHNSPAITGFSVKIYSTMF